MGFQKATKKKAKARIGLCGPAGSGKTYSALKIATHLGEKVAAIDTEHGSMSKYADEFDFDVLELDSFHPQNYINAIHMAEAAGYDVLIIDSLTHAWNGKDGVVDIKEKAEAKYKGNSWTAWRDATPLHNALVEAILQSKLHIIATMRSKMDYVQVQDERGKTRIEKVGMAPIQRDGMEYEFDIIGDLTVDHVLQVTKTRCKALDNAVIKHPGAEFGQAVKDWLTDGVDAPEVPRPITSHTIGLLKTAWLECGYKPETLNKQIIKTYQKNGITDLTEEQGLELLEKLKPTEPQAG